MVGGGGGSGGGGGIGVWRLEGEGGKANSGRFGGRGGGGIMEDWDAGVWGGGICGSKEGEHGEIILGSVTWVGRWRMREGRILQNVLVAGMEILKVLELSSRFWGLSSGTENTRAKIWNLGSWD